MCKKVTVLLLLCLLLQDTALGKRTRKIKRTKNEEEETTTSPPNVVTYSSFGFGDAGPGYDGFVPSSPDYATYLSNYQETSTRLYAPAFPTAADSAYNSNYNQDAQSYSSAADGDQSNIYQEYQQNFNYMNPTYDSVTGNHYPQGQDQLSNKNYDDSNSPVYGVKLNSRSRARPISKLESNSTQIFGSDNYQGSDPYSGQTNQEVKTSYGESSSNFAYNNNNNAYSYAPTFSPIVAEEVNPMPVVPKNSVKFQKVVDFTKFKPEYPSEMENKYGTATMKSISAYHEMASNNENSFNFNNYNRDSDNSFAKYKNMFDGEESEKFGPKPIGSNHMEYTVNHIDNKNAFKNSKLYSDYKDQYKPYSDQYKYNESSDVSSWKQNVKVMDANNNVAFSYGYSHKKPYKGHSDEVVAASSNSFDYTNQPSSNSEPSFKKFPSYKPIYTETPYNPYENHDDLSKEDENISHFKHLYTTTPSPPYSGSYKSKEHPSYSKNRYRKPQYDENNDEIVHIPKKSKYQSSKYHGRYKGKHSESSRFKSEEDLLGLRNHDTSHPSYLPNYKLNDMDEDLQKYPSENGYKSLLDKWRQSYLKSKYQKEQEIYSSESRPIHVPIPKPYPIEVPHPVIVPVPQPYPVKVAVPKPVAVPFIREITIPIEKPVPYPVYKNVPYPVEKPVAVPVEKEVPVPVMKPYPVPVPQVRPVFHHTKHHDEFDMDPDNAEEEHYFSRPERPEPPKKLRYVKKTKSIRLKRRPTYYERKRRRTPPSYRRPAPSFRREAALAKARRYRPKLHEPRYAPKYKDEEFEEENDERDFYEYCKKSGNC